MKVLTIDQFRKLVTAKKPQKAKTNRRINNPEQLKGEVVMTEEVIGLVTIYKFKMKKK